MVAVDRFDEFTEILNDKQKEIPSKNEPILRNRTTKADKTDKTAKLNDETNSIFTFSKSFLSECTLINTTLIQLNDKLKKISQKPDQISFSFSSPISPNNPTASIEEALNICSMNVSVLRKKLNDKETEGNVTESKGFFSSWLSFNGPNTAKHCHPIMEHCKLVLSFLENRVGRITEDLETFKRRKKNRESLLSNKNSNVTSNRYSSANLNNNSGPHVSNNNTSPYGPNVNTHSDNNANTSSDSLQMLQVENSKMIEEMSRGLFETLSTTESQVLEIARLQATLQSHLTVQHDLTCRLFDDSLSTFQDTQKGNEYLKKARKDGSVMRKFLVALILGMSLLLLLLHFFNK